MTKIITIDHDHDQSNQALAQCLCLQMLQVLSLRFFSQVVVDYDDDINDNTDNIDDHHNHAHQYLASVHLTGGPSPPLSFNWLQLSSIPLQPALTTHLTSQDSEECSTPCPGTIFALILTTTIRMSLPPKTALMSDSVPQFAQENVDLPFLILLITVFLLPALGGCLPPALWCDGSQDCPSGYQASA